MAKYAATKSVTIYNTVETAVAGLATYIATITTGTTANLKCGINRIEANKYAAWVVYTNVA